MPHTKMGHVIAIRESRSDQDVLLSVLRQPLHNHNQPRSPIQIEQKGSIRDFARRTNFAEQLVIARSDFLLSSWGRGGGHDRVSPEGVGGEEEESGSTACGCAEDDGCEESQFCGDSIDSAQGC